MPARSGKLSRAIAALAAIALLPLVMLACPSCGETTAAFSPERQEQLGEVVADYMREHHLPGAVVGAWVPGEGEYVAATGQADLETGEAMDLEDRFQIGSVTKSFVGTVALQLVDEGRLGLDDRLGRYTDLVPNGDDITVRQLLDMTSGLYSYLDDESLEAEAAENPLRKWPPEELIRTAIAHEPSFPPGEGWQYSNTNTTLVGMIIEGVTGNDLEDEIQSRIIEPLGLENTSFPREPGVDPPYARGYSYDMESGEFTAEPCIDPSFFWAAGAMISNLEDLRVWAEALGKGTLISEAMQRERLLFHDATAGELPYLKTMVPGYGMALEKYDSPDSFIGHSGKTFSHNAQMYYLPSRGAVLITLTNTTTIPGDGPEFFATFAQAVLPEAFPRYPGAR